MTTLVAVRKHDQIAIAADSLTTFGDVAPRRRITTRSFDKIVALPRQLHRPVRLGRAPARVREPARRAASDYDFSSRARDLRDAAQAAPDPQGPALPESEGGGGRSVRVDADHRADREPARHLRRVLDARGVRVHAVLGRRLGQARSRSARCTRCIRASRPPRRSRARASRPAPRSTQLGAADDAVHGQGASDGARDAVRHALALRVRGRRGARHARAAVRRRRARSSRAHAVPAVARARARRAHRRRRAARRGAQVRRAA